MTQITIKIKGMRCVSCENKIKDAILSLNGMKDTKVDYTTEKAAVEFDSTKTNIEDIIKVIKNVGYQPEEMNNKESKGFFKKIFG